MSELMICHALQHVLRGLAAQPAIWGSKVQQQLQLLDELKAAAVKSATRLQQTALRRSQMLSHPFSQTCSMLWSSWRRPAGRCNSVLTPPQLQARVRSSWNLFGGAAASFAEAALQMAGQLGSLLQPSLPVSPLGLLPWMRLQHALGWASSRMAQEFLTQPGLAASSSLFATQAVLRAVEPLLNALPPADQPPLPAGEPPLALQPGVPFWEEVAAMGEAAVGMLVHFFYNGKGGGWWLAQVTVFYPGSGEHTIVYSAALEAETRQRLNFATEAVGKLRHALPVWSALGSTHQSISLSLSERCVFAGPPRLAVSFCLQ